MTDTTGWCDRGDHERCHFGLKSGTDWHWWCACRCHPTPTRQDAPFAPVADFDKALNTWRKARAVLKGAS